MAAPPQAHRPPPSRPGPVASGRPSGAARSKRAGGTNRDPPIQSNGSPGPTTVFVRGTSRPVVNSVGFALAELTDLTPLWLDVRDDTDGPSGPDPGTMGWIPPDRLFVSENGAGLAAGAPGAMKALWTIVRADEPAEVLSNLTDFLRLPELIQEILSAASSNGAPRALVLANSDRVAHLFPRSAEGLQKFLATLAASSLSIVAAHTGPSAPSRFGFGTVFRVEADSPTRWIEGTIICEQGIESGPFAIGRVNRLSDIPGIARVFTGLFPVRP